MTSVEDQLIQRVRAFKPDTSKQVKPYKWVLLAAVVTLIHKGVQQNAMVQLDGALTSMFHQLMDDLYPSWPVKTPPKPANPFRALMTEQLWTLVPKQDSHAALAQELQLGTWDVMRHVSHAQLPAPVFALLASDPAARLRLLDVIAQCLPANFLVPNPLQTLMRNLGADGWTLANQDRLGQARHWTERLVEETLEHAWRRTPFHTQLGIRLADPASDRVRARQLKTPMNCIDLLGYQEAARTWWVFELKYGDASSHAVSQVLAYQHHIEHEVATRSQATVAAVVTDETSPKLLAAARQARVQVWQYNAANLANGIFTMQQAA